jgi:hypothetical protein
MGSLKPYEVSEKGYSSALWASPTTTFCKKWVFPPSKGVGDEHGSRIYRIGIDGAADGDELDRRGGQIARV